ncbi:MAG: GNAT family N-acetyltransferase [Chloroflexi bacterium]|nr:GNAT family N-acetyltransferase [Chloroflexota bacterium]
MNDLTRRALDVNQAYLALGNEQFDADGGSFVRNREEPEIHDSNHVTRITASSPAEIDRLLIRVEREFADIPHRAYHIYNDTPPAVEARLALEGFERSDALVMLLEGDLTGQAKDHDIRLVEGEDSWQAYRSLHLAGWIAYREAAGETDPSAAGEAMFRSRRAKSPPMRYWLAYVDGAPSAYFASWEGRDGVGQVEDLYTRPEFRHRGLATALIHHCVADCRSHGAGPVVIVCDPGDRPKQMYAAMGFRPVAMKRSYWKNAGP